ncbi:MAG: SMI1/KNR4 family protein [Hydrogenophaga sp.]|nr:SMI1/KNR4 family protein [Hydrogenophaga sp.]
MVSTRISEIANRLLTGRRKAFLRTVPLFDVFEPYYQPTTVVGAEIPVPGAIAALLMKTGYGDIAEALSFRSSWFQVIDRGELKGHVIFAQDDIGNYYTSDGPTGRIHFVCRHSPEYALMSDSFEDFLEGFEQRRYKLADWTNSLQSRPYSWG